MGILDLFKKKQDYDVGDSGDSVNLGLNNDPFKSDPLMDINSGLNLPQDNNPDPFQNHGGNQYQQQDPFQKYKHPGQNYEQNNYNQTQTNTDTQKDMQIIIAKLDALRAEIQTLNHKIEKIEEKQQKRMW
jgi:hypothetical protein